MQPNLKENGREANVKIYRESSLYEILRRGQDTDVSLDPHQQDRVHPVLRPQRLQTTHQLRDQHRETGLLRHLGLRFQQGPQLGNRGAQALKKQKNILFKDKDIEIQYVITLGYCSVARTRRSRILAVLSIRSALLTTVGK